MLCGAERNSGVGSEGCLRSAESIGFMMVFAYPEIVA
jgi:hypothetical protein